MPFERNPRFTGRESQLAKLENKLSKQAQTTRLAIIGLGGVGKTQLVLELVYQTREKHKNCSVIWIPATNMESLEQAYLELARQLCVPGWQEDKSNVKRLVQNHLSEESSGQWLLVFDNADDIDMWIPQARSKQESENLIDYLPRSEQGSIVFTTRDRRIAVKLAQNNVLEVSEMGEEVATDLLQKCLVDTDLLNNKPATKALLNELTCLPLAIVQAAAYINENGIAIADYVSLLEEQEEEVIDLLSEEFEDNGRYRNVKNPVATTWLISFEQIRHRDPLAAEYLSFMACIDSRDIPQSLLPVGQSRKKETEAIGTLDAYSFIKKRPDKRPDNLAFDIHRLVHLATRNWLRKQEQITQWTRKAITRLEEVLPSHEHQNRNVWRIYLPHIRYALVSNLIEKDGPNRIELVRRFGLCLYSDGRYDEAEVQFIEVLEFEKRVLGQEHPNTLASMANLVLTFLDQGRYKEAEDLQILEIEINKKVLGQEHPDMLASMANLALTFSYQGRYKEAEDLQMLVIETGKRVLGQEHPDTLTSMANLALTFWNQGRYKEAEDLQILEIEMSKKMLGQEHPDMLTSMANLALTFSCQGRYKEAEDLQVLVMETRKRVLGQEHPDTLNSMANLASTFWNQGRYKDAEDLEVLVIEMRKKVLGQEHPETLTSMANLALTFSCQDRYKEAEDLQVLVMETRKRVLGQEHPDTLNSMANLASTFSNQGCYKKAEDLQVLVIEMGGKVLGQEHPDRLTSMANLALTLRVQGKDKQALNLMEQCVALRSKIIGTNHPDTLSSCKVLLEWQTEELEHSTLGDK